MAENRVFYSKCAGLTYWPDDVQEVIMNGHKTVSTPAPIRFTQLGQTPFGHYSTSNPAHIASLEARIRDIGDVMSPEEFNKAMTPQSDQIKSLEQKVRELEQRNNLLEQLKAQGKITPPLAGK